MTDQHTAPTDPLADNAPTLTDQPPRGRRFVIILIEWIAGLIGLGLFAIALVFARLAAGPLSTDVLTPVIENVLARSAGDLVPSIGHTELTWDREARQLELRLDNTVLNNAQGETVVAMPQAILRVRVLGLLSGRLDFSDIAISGLNMRLERTGDGQLTFYGVMPQPDANPTPPAPLSDSLEAWPRQLATLQQEIAQLRSLTINEVQISLTDRGRADANGVAPVEVMTLPDMTIQRAGDRVVGTAQVNLALQPTPLQFSLAVDMAAKTGVGTIKLVWEKMNLGAFSSLAPALGNLSGLSVPLGGSLTVTYTGTRGDSPMLVALETTADAGTLQIPDVLPDKTVVKGGHLLLTASASVEDGIQAASLRDTRIDLNGPVITANVDLASTESFIAPTRALKADVTLKNVPVSSLNNLWPSQVVPGAREWVTQSMRDGMAEATFAMESRVGWPSLNSFEIDKLGGTINMDGTTVDYLPDLPPVIGASATATYDAEQMKIAISGGTMNSVQVQPSTVTISLLPRPVESIAMEINGSGPLPRILEAIDKPPLGYAKRIGIAPADMKGDAQFTMNLSFPLLADLQMDQVKIGLAGTVKNFASDKLVSGIKLTDGVLNLLLTSTEMNITGPVNINQSPANVTWKEIFDAGTGPGSTALITTTLNTRLLNNLEIPGGEYFDGNMPLTIKYLRYDQGGDTADISADLTPGALKLTPLAYEKPVGAAGKLSAKVKFPPAGNKIAPIQITSITGTAPGLNLQAKANLLRNPMRLQNVVVTRGQFGANSFTADLSRLEGRSGVAGWQGTIDASQLNVESMRGDKEEKNSERLPPLDLTLRAQKLSLADKKNVTGFRAVLKRDGINWQQLDIDLKAGEAPFMLRLLPVFGGGQSLKIETPDLGAVLQATDQTDTILDGKLLVTGSSKGPGEPLEATVDLRNYRVRNMPFVASLISAISAEGLLNALSREEGLSFSRLRGDISWQDDEIKLRHVKTSGGALGLTVAGTVNTYAETVDLQGTAVPFNSVNSLLGNVPIVGSILGGSSGVFAATYSAQGPFDNIRVGVNPLSILAPGFLRDLFFIEG